MENVYRSLGVQKPKSSILLGCLSLLLIALVLSGNAVSAQTVKAKMKITIYLPSPDETTSDCGAVRALTRKIATTKQTADAALNLLFADPLAEEKSDGSQSLSPLRDFYVGVTIKKGAATVNFCSGAGKYLYVSGPICRQTRVLTAIEKTLLQFGSIKSVKYAIDGVIVEAWDA
jgi:Sporulation and spore germination